jgi:formylglycine-generating enzyme required for sulfatase activity
MRSLFRLNSLLLAIAFLSQAVTAEDNKKHKVGDTFKDCEECPEMVVVPAGSFMMGARPYDKMTKKDVELPYHKQEIGNEFAIGKFEVTYSQYLACYEAGGCSQGPYPFGWGGDTQPLSGISWEQAKEYTDWLTEKTGHQYRLPSSIEWEYAARGGTDTIYPWGDDLGVLKAKCEPCDGIGAFSTSFKAPVPIGTYKSNGFGLHDMIGNVQEWVADCFYLSPDDVFQKMPWIVDGTCENHESRGGSYKTSNQYWVRPSARQIGRKGKIYQWYGFRVLRDLK